MSLLWQHTGFSQCCHFSHTLAAPCNLEHFRGIKEPPASCSAHLHRVTAGLASQTDSAQPTQSLLSGRTLTNRGSNFKYTDCPGCALVFPFLQSLPFIHNPWLVCRCCHA